MQLPAQSGRSCVAAGLVLKLLVCCRLAWACERVQFGPAPELNIACRCHSQHCDPPLQFDWPPDDSHLVELLSARSGARFQLRNVSLAQLIDRGKQVSVDEDEAERVVQLDVNKRQQRVVGYGGAFTDSASMLIGSRLEAAARDCLMRSYFGPQGLDYNLVRVPIGGTDMSWRPYSYDDLPLDSAAGAGAGRAHDFELANFRLQPEDLEFKLPLIRQARQIRLAARSSGLKQRCQDGEQPLRVMASSWSAPNWMKSNENLVQGHLKESFDGKYYDAYARYLIRFMEEYERQVNGPEESGASEPEAGECPFRVWSLTPQNEPCTPGRLGYSVVNYNSVNFEPKQMGQFVRFNLIPQLLRHNRTARHLALFIWDDTLLGFDKYKQHLFENNFEPSDEAEAEEELDDVALGSEPAQLEQKRLKSGYADFDRRTIDEYVRGLALHWYSQALDKLPYRSLFEMRRWLPARYSMISTEASFIGRPRPGAWERGERYARDIIENLRAGSLGWIDWNLALNMAGGPTWSGNFLDSAILIEDHGDRRPEKANSSSSSSNQSTFYKNPMFYAIGHLSRFIRRHSHVLASQILINDFRERRNSTQDQQLLAALRQKSQLTPNEQSQLAVLAKEAGWRLVDELEEQTSELLVVASELDESPHASWRRIALVLLNRADRKLRVKLNVANCKSRVGARTLALQLEPKSITSYAFNC